VEKLCVLLRLYASFSLPLVFAFRLILFLEPRFILVGIEEYLVLLCFILFLVVVIVVFGIIKCPGILLHFHEFFKADERAIIGGEDDVVRVFMPVTSFSGAMLILVPDKRATF
jgi:hypothetical protein